MSKRYFIVCYLLIFYVLVFQHHSEANYQLIGLRSFLIEPGGFHIIPLESKLKVKEGVVEKITGAKERLKQHVIKIRRVQIQSEPFELSLPQQDSF